MSSTGKTERLGLCQWELTDAFRMEDMNGDNVKIDEAIAERPLVKLAAVTLQESTETVTVSLNGIDLRRYAALHVYYPAGENIRMKINNYSGVLDYYNSGGNWQSGGPSTTSCDGHVSITSTYSLGSASGTLYLRGTNLFRVSASSTGAIKSLSFVGNSAFPSGSSFIVLGVEA